jgi:hypothetical protein
MRDIGVGPVFVEAAGGETERAPSGLAAAAVALHLSAFAIDYRSENVGGDAYQVVLLGVSLASFAVGWWALGSRRGRADPLAGLVALLLAGLLVYGTVVAMAWGVPLGNLLRLDLRFVLLLLSLLLTARWLGLGYGHAFIVRTLAIGGILSILSSTFYFLLVVGVRFEQIRYHVAPPAALVIVGLTLRRAAGLQPAALLVAAIGIGAIYFSATRTYALSLLAMVALLALVAVRWKDGQTLALLGGWLLAAALTVALAGFSSEIWLERFRFGAGRDPTWLTRLAEYTTQMRLLTASEWSVLFGRGLGSSFTWDVDVVRDLYLSGVLPVEDRWAEYFEFGHGLWVYSLYAYGILGGWVLPAVLLLPLLAAIGTALRRGVDPGDRLAVTGVALALAAIFVASFFGFPFGDRLACIQFGALVAIAGAVRAAARQNRPGEESPKRGAARFGLRQGSLGVVSGK